MHAKVTSFRGFGAYDTMDWNPKHGSRRDIISVSNPDEADPASTRLAGSDRPLQTVLKGLKKKVKFSPQIIAEDRIYVTRYHVWRSRSALALAAASNSLYVPLLRHMVRKIPFSLDIKLRGVSNSAIFKSQRFSTCVTTEAERYVPDPCPTRWDDRSQWQFADGEQLSKRGI